MKLSPHKTASPVVLAALLTVVIIGAATVEYTITQPADSPVFSSLRISTASKKLYTSSDRTFTVRTQPGWSFKTRASAPGIIFIVGPPPPNPKTMSGYSSNIKETLYKGSITSYLADLQKVQDAYKASGSPYHDLKPAQEITLNGMKGYKISNQNEGVDAQVSDWYLFQRDDTIYQINLYSTAGNGDAYDLKPYVATANTIVSSFKLAK
jgi:hypothetical protein